MFPVFVWENHSVPFKCRQGEDMATCWRVNLFPLAWFICSTIAERKETPNCQKQRYKVIE